MLTKIFRSIRKSLLKVIAETTTTLQRSYPPIKKKNKLMARLRYDFTFLI